jgi:hypothetical protein
LDESVSIHGQTTFLFTPAINPQFVSAMLDLQDDTVIAGGCSRGTQIFDDAREVQPPLSAWLSKLSRAQREACMDWYSEEILKVVDFVDGGLE